MIRSILRRPNIKVAVGRRIVEKKLKGTCCSVIVSNVGKHSCHVWFRKNCKKAHRLFLESGMTFALDYVRLTRIFAKCAFEDETSIEATVSYWKRTVRSKNRRKS